MTLLRKLGIGPDQVGPEKILQTRAAQFEQLLLNYGQVLDLIEDAAEKQGGEYILDQQYLSSLADSLFNLAKAAVFDMTVITDKRHLAAFDMLERFESEGRAIVELCRDEAAKGEAGHSGPPKSAFTPKDLAEAISGHETVLSDSGRVAARGVAVGEVFNLKAGADLDKFPEGGIWVSDSFERAAGLTRIIKNVGAILCDTGSPRDYICRLARNYRVPAIVGAAGASSLLESGETITVDAEDNAVYRGAIPELVEYFREREAPGQEEEYEYRMLRAFRRKLFPLRISRVRDGLPGFGDLETFHDLVHLCHELAGDALAETVLNKKNQKLPKAALDPALAGRALALELDPRAGRENAARLECPALAAFIRGLQKFEDTGDGPGKNRSSQMTALVSRRRANIVLPGKGGFDMIDANIEARETNFIYCRFDTGFNDLERRFGRRDLALDILSRLDFAASETNRAVAAWVHRVENREAEERIETLGKLRGFLQQKDAEGWERAKVSEEIESFLDQHIRQHIRHGA